MKKVYRKCEKYLSTKRKYGNTNRGKDLGLDLCPSGKYIIVPWNGIQALTLTHAGENSCSYKKFFTTTHKTEQIANSINQNNSTSYKNPFIKDKKY